MQAVVDLMSKQAENTSGSQIILEELKQIYGYNVDAELNQDHTEEIVDRLRQDKQEIEARASMIKANLVEGLATLFDPDGDTYLDYLNAISEWHNQLHPDQKLETSHWQSRATRTILQALPKLQDVEKMFLETIPAAPGFEFGKVDDWSHDQAAGYLSQFENALKMIEDSLPKVPIPIWETSGDVSLTLRGAHVVEFSGSVRLEVKAPAEGITVRVTKNEDPVSAKQFHTVAHPNPWSTEITESCSYHLVSQSSHGDFGKVVRIGLTNLDDGYRLIAEDRPKLLPSERQYRFRNPIDKRGLVVLLLDIISHLRSDQLIAAADIVGAFQEAVNAELPDSEG